MQLTVTIPDSAGVSKTDAQIMLAIKLFETKRLPLGKAAKVAGLSYRTFYELLIKYGVPIVTLTEDYIRKEIENAGFSPHNEPPRRNADPARLLSMYLFCLSTDCAD